VEWLPFFLSPHTPPEGENLREHLAAKYGEAMAKKFTSPGNPLDVAGRGVGILFNPSRRFINTASAHRLMEHVNATQPDKGDSLMEAMFHAYFEEAKDLSKLEELVNVAAQVGLDREFVEAMISSAANLDAAVSRSVRDSQSRLKVRGVPFFLIEPLDGGRPIAFSGAQPPDVIAEQLLEAAGI